ncbi:flagellar hook-length control protein FliK [Clostridium swellfunianum]|uniref:flagellar hook-length control protein FliK n=1 Tax=Clostridium swellfunianum TaxID=1367462 RepID=UPI00202DFB33|nr:flagellar hook-length control protein FliK [Clostridium swellfunianum]MCM0650446.1 flagellar hook-length control protein FliK [Clostridium swellfunianum]
MDSVNIKALSGKTTPAEMIPKANAKLDDKSFAKIIDKKLGEDIKKPENKEVEAKPSNINKTTDMAKHEEEQVEGNDTLDKAEPSETVDKKLMELLQLLASLGGTTKPKDILKLKQIVSEFFQGNKIEETNPIKTNADVLGLELGTIIDDKPTKLSELASKIVDKLASDSNFKDKLTAVISKINQDFGLITADDDKALRQAIIKELDSLVNSDVKSTSKTEFSIKDQETVNSLQHSEQVKIESVDSTIIETNKASTESSNYKRIQLDIKPGESEDKLLKGLLEKVDKKDPISNLTDRIANVVTRFEVIRTDKPLSAEAPVVINKDSFNMDFIKAVKFMDTNNLKELSVKILPKDLGEIIIRLSMDNGVMKANITASSKETYNLLNSQLPVISNQLAEQNMNIQSFNLSLYNGENFLFNGNGDSKRDGRQQGRKDSEIASIDNDDAVVQNYDIQDGNINALA